MRMKLRRGMRRALALLGIALLLCGTHAWAENLGAAPQTNVAVQGQTGAQPERAFLNFVNRVGNVMAPVGASGAAVGAWRRQVAGPLGARSGGPPGPWNSPQAAAFKVRPQSSPDRPSARRQ